MASVKIPPQFINPNLKEICSPTDLNECNTTGANNCSQNADCVNKPGSFLCSCKPDYIGDGVNCTKCVAYNGSCYTLFINPVSWKKANATCEAHNTHLVKIESNYENAFLRDVVLKNGEAPWIGLNDLDNEGVFVWYDGTTLTGYENWHGGNPNNGVGNDGGNQEEDCVSFSGREWIDVDCETRMGYVCEKEAR